MVADVFGLKKKIKNYYKYNLYISFLIDQPLLIEK